MRKIQERNTKLIKDYFRLLSRLQLCRRACLGLYSWHARECDTDGEPGLDAREIALLLQSLGYLPDMACISLQSGWRGVGRSVVYGASLCEQPTTLQRRPRVVLGQAFLVLFGIP